MIYGYARVSTKGQARDGNSLEEQKNKLRAAGAEVIFADSFTGTKMERPELNKLQEQIKTGDTVIVTKLDRIARSASGGAELVKQFLDKGVSVNILNMGLANSTPTGKLMMNIMFAFAEFERDMIVERTQEGKAIAKMNPNYREGRPHKYSTYKMNHAMELLQTNSYRQVEEMTGISMSTLKRENRRRKINK